MDVERRSPRRRPRAQRALQRQRQRMPVWIAYAKDVEGLRVHESTSAHDPPILFSRCSCAGSVLAHLAHPNRSRPARPGTPSRTSHFALDEATPRAPTLRQRHLHHRPRPIVAQDVTGARTPLALILAHFTSPTARRACPRTSTSTSTSPSTYTSTSTSCRARRPLTHSTRTTPAAPALHRRASCPRAHHSHVHLAHPIPDLSSLLTPLTHSTHHELSPRESCAGCYLPSARPPVRAHTSHPRRAPAPALRQRHSIPIPARRRSYLSLPLALRHTNHSRTLPTLFDPRPTLPTLLSSPKKERKKESNKTRRTLSALSAIFPPAALSTSAML
jgi:hypothetical protein